MNDKINTSIQYQFTNIKLFDDIFLDWKKFDENLRKGPIFMKEYLYNEWNKLKENLKDNDRIFLKDLNKEVKMEDFDVTFNKSDSGTPIFFFTFPDYEYTDAASKYVALVLGDKVPRYITLEYSEDYITKQKKYVIGEFYINEKNQKEHKNYGSVDDDRISYFAGYVLGMIS